MRRRPPPFIFIAIVAVIAGFLLLGAVFGGGGWRHDNESRVTIVNPGNGTSNGNSVTVDGQSVAPGSVVVIDNGRRGPGFFPFFPIFPLLFLGFLIFLFTRARRFRGNCGGPGFGPNRWNGGPDDRGPGGPSHSSTSPEHAWFTREDPAPASPATSAPAPHSGNAPQPVADAPAADALASEPESGSSSQS
jgi:hypothetical protein